ncbi:NF-kappa-B inhibitor alpha-like [Tubulanus polymorphus]|uniref:NF-kappa-B inhibitor alpha-like n=1 Tax=Tubulanus polymorphus TaxID=672921 RepID=UPI003DA41516
MAELKRSRILNSDLQANARSDADTFKNIDNNHSKESWPLSKEYMSYFESGESSVLFRQNDDKKVNARSSDSGFGSSHSGSCHEEDVLHEKMSAMNINGDESNSRDELKPPKFAGRTLDSGIESGNLSGIVEGMSVVEVEKTPSASEESLESSSSSCVDSRDKLPGDEGFSDGCMLQQVHLTAQQRIDLYKQDAEGDTQLHIAIIQCMGDELLGLYDTVVQIIRLALNASYLDVQNFLQQTPLILAALTKQPHIVWQLLLAGASTHPTDRHGDMALAIAAKNGDLETVKALTSRIVIDDEEIDTDAFQALSKIINKKNYEGYAPIHLAVLHGHFDVMEHLYNCGADINAKCDKTGETILHLLVKSHNTDILENVYNYPVDVEAVTFSNMTALNLAVELRLNDVSEFLINKMSVDRSELEFYPVDDCSEEEEMEDDFVINGQPITTTS